MKYNNRTLKIYYMKYNNRTLKIYYMKYNNKTLKIYYMKYNNRTLKIYYMNLIIGNFVKIFLKISISTCLVRQEINSG